MTDNATHHDERSVPSASADFLTGEELRCLLRRLHMQGQDAWMGDPVVADLPEYTSEKYAGLASKHLSQRSLHGV